MLRWRQEAQVGVTDGRVADPAKRRQDGRDEALLALRGAHVHARGVVVDQVVHDLDRRPGGLAPQVGLFADDLVGVLALGQLDDADVDEADARVRAARRALDLADEGVELRDPERAGTLAGRVDVVGEGDPLGVLEDERDLARGQGRAQRGDDVVEAGLVGHERVGIALDDDRLAALADGALGLVDQVQGPALVEERGARGVEVLRSVVARVRTLGRLAGRDEVPAAQADGATGLVADREDDPFAEPVVRAAPAAERGVVRPTSASSSGRTPRLRASVPLIVSQPPGAQPSWKREIVSSVNPRSRR